MRDPTANLAHKRRYDGSGAEMMLIGTPCALEQCNREDFLPLSCSQCHRSYCSEHAQPPSHHCKSQSVTQDFYVPLCPVCQDVFPGWQRPLDPSRAAQQRAQNETDQALARHLRSCTAMRKLVDSRPGEHVDLVSGLDKEGRPTKTIPGKVCRAKACTKTLIAPIVCPGCNESFCPAHRMPEQHRCSASASTSSTPKTSSSANNLNKGLTGFLSNATTAKPTKAATPKPMASLRPPPETQSKSTHKSQQTSENDTWSFASWRKKLNGVKSNVGLSETQKRATEERKSQLRAMAARHERGLLSAKEQVLYAELCAQYPEQAKHSLFRTRGSS